MTRKLTGSHPMCFGLLILQCLQVAISSTPGGGIPTSPIRHWDASWAASCVQGTAIATVFEDCAILFLRSPATNIWREGIPMSDAIGEDLMGLKVYPMDSSSPTVEFAPSWLSFPNGLCVMTGLASDVEHLCRILQRQVDSHLNIYDDRLTVHSMTECVSDLFRQTAFSKGGRPFGVQTLLLGGDDIDKTKRFCLYTIDPSGSWQSWPWGTAIGKFAKEVRSDLAKAIEKQGSSSPDTLKGALDQIIRCWTDTCQKQNLKVDSKDDFQVLILRVASNSKECKIYRMKQDDIQELVENAIDMLASE